MPPVIDDVRADFFELIFGDEEGMLCIASTHKIRGRESFKRYFFRWPHQTKEMLDFIEQKEKHHNVWFSTALFDRSEAKKQYARPTKIVWADLDTCDPNSIAPSPPIIMESSPGRWQALWTLDAYIEPEIAEDYAKRIAYAYQKDGADVSGWDIGQLLRVPYTHNYKSEYMQIGGDAPQVDLTRFVDMPVPLTIFESIELPQNGTVPKSAIEMPAPDVDTLPDPQTVIQRYFVHISDQPRFMDKFENAPDEEEDWSGIMWNMINMCFEAGMDEKETYAVVRVAACNKYIRDNRPDRYLWYEVLKCKAMYVRIGEFKVESTTFNMPPIYDPDKDGNYTYIDMYREFGVRATDAPPQFHDLGAFMILSSLLSANLELRTSFGTIRPNLWGLVLGESTITRKTTATRMAIEVISGIDVDLILATEGSIEGIVTSLSARNHEVSIFFRDEVSGFFEQITRKDYLSGTQEVFTQLYDVPALYRRNLRKEVINVQSPLFIFFGGGIRERTYGALREQAVTSGFLPRFLIVGGDTDLERVRPLGPPLSEIQEGKLEVVQHAQHLYNTYHKSGTIKIPGSDTNIDRPVVVSAELTSDAWQHYQNIDMAMLKMAHDSPLADLALPTMQRLSTSLMKMALLVAASRQEPTSENTIAVELRDIISAAKYIQSWGMYSIDAILNVGKGVSERELQKILKSIQRHPGIARSYLMRINHMQKRETDDMIDTLVQRGHIRIEKVGRAHHYFAIDD
jgi:hypothetical protein